jgi:aryl-alcohol dehydrogenase-like predicted oxidoreductase
MKTQLFGTTNEVVSEICLGSMLMGTTINKDVSFEILDRFIDANGNFIDTANCYAWWIGKGEFLGDESELILGEWMKERKNRNKVFLATKAGARIINPSIIRDSNGAPKWDIVPENYEGLSSKTIRKAVEDSLRRLQTDYIDLYYAHIDDRKVPLEETLSTLNDLVNEGKIKYVGCSNLKTWRLAEARSISHSNKWALYTAIQQQYSYFQPKFNADFGVGVNANDELFDYIRNNNDLTLIAYSPLLKGIYDSEEKRRSYYNWSFFDTFDNEKRLQVITQIANEMNVSNNQLVLAWLLNHEPRVIPIVGFSSVEQFTQNMKAVDIRLSVDQMNRLNNF